MTTSPEIHCPECGSYSRRATQDDGCEVLICTDDDCPRVVVSVLSRPEPFVRDPESWQAVAAAGRKYA